MRPLWQVFAPSILGWEEMLFDVCYRSIAVGGPTHVVGTPDVLILGSKLCPTGVQLGFEILLLCRTQLRQGIRCFV